MQITDKLFDGRALRSALFLCAKRENEVKVNFIFYSEEMGVQISIRNPLLSRK